jgi:hypothetical protein
MSISSQEKFNEYAKNVLNRSRIYLEEIVEIEQVILKEK